MINNRTINITMIFVLYNTIKKMFFLNIFYDTFIIMANICINLQIYNKKKIFKFVYKFIFMK